MIYNHLSVRFFLKVIILTQLISNPFILGQSIKDKLIVKQDSLAIIDSIIREKVERFSFEENKIEIKRLVLTQKLDSLERELAKANQNEVNLSRFKTNITDTLELLLSKRDFMVEDIGINYNGKFFDKTNVEGLRIIFFDKKTLKPIVFYSTIVFHTLSDGPEVYIEYDERGLAHGRCYVNQIEYKMRHGIPVGKFVIPVSYIFQRDFDDRLGMRELQSDSYMERDGSSYIHYVVVSGNCEEGHLNGDVFIYNVGISDHTIDKRGFNKFGFTDRNRIDERWEPYSAIRFSYGIPTNMVMADGRYLQFNDSSEVVCYKRFSVDVDLGLYLTDSINLLTSEGIMLLDRQYYKYSNHDGTSQSKYSESDVKVYESPFVIMTGDGAREVFYFNPNKPLKLNLEKLIMNNLINWFDIGASSSSSVWDSIRVFRILSEASKK